MATRLRSILVLVLLPMAVLAVPLHAENANQTTRAVLPEGLDQSDWRAISAQILAHQQAPSFRAMRGPSGGSYAATNPVHGFRIRYSDDGATELEVATGPEDAPAHRIALKPLAVGYGDSLKTLADPVARSAEDQRVDTVWDSQLREWWVNSAGGLEQWFELAEPPAGRNESPLRLELALDTTLTAELAGMGDARHLLLHDGATRVRFEKLLVEDATGRRLPAHMTLKANRYNNRLAYVIDDSQAVYPLTIDPTFVQQAYLKASNTDTEDQFGFSVAVSGDTIVVGARFEDSSASGIDGDQLNNLAVDSGAAYVFVRSGASWVQEAYLKPFNTGAGDEFGYSVAISGDTVVVGAPKEDSNATGIDGDQANDLAENSGAAYVYVRSGSTWSQQAYLKASNTDAGDSFGSSVAVSADTVVVGTELEDSNATGVDGDQGDNSANWAGAAYVFVRSGDTWSQQAYLKASNTGSNDRFGSSVAISGDTVVVGAWFEDSSALDSGAAYVFVRVGSTWAQQAFIKASNPDVADGFGYSVALSGDTMVVTAPQEDSDASGVNGNQSSNSAENSGAAYVFVRSGINWTQQAYIKASNTESGDRFGWSAAISENTLVVGTWYEDSSATGINGDPCNNSSDRSGAAYLFTRFGTSWSQQGYLKASNSASNDRFGWSVSISNQSVAVGAYFEDSEATGTDGNQGNNAAENSGAAYIFNLEDFSGRIFYDRFQSSACPP